jgi:uncharacterized RDD family membrane protein YckC
MAAGLIDTVIVVAYIVLVAYGMSLVEIDSAALGISALVIPSLLYHLLFEIFMDGQSPGKRQMKIKVVRTDGTPATIGNYLLRWLLRLVEVQAAQGMIAVITIAWNGRGQRLGDIAAGTTVVKLVRQKDVTAAEIFTLAADDYVPQFPGVIMLSDRDAELIQQALEVYRRHDNLQPAMIVTEKIKTRLGIQTDMTFEAFLTTILKDYSQLTAGK